MSNTWYGPVENGTVNGHVLTDLCYSPDKRLIGVFMTLKNLTLTIHSILNAIEVSNQIGSY